MLWILRLLRGFRLATGVVSTTSQRWISPGRKAAGLRIANLLRALVAVITSYGTGITRAGGGLLYI